MWARDIGERLARDWREIGVRLARDWRKMGARLALCTQTGRLRATAAGRAGNTAVSEPVLCHTNNNYILLISTAVSEPVLCRADALSLRAAPYRTIGHCV